MRNRQVVADNLGTTHQPCWRQRYATPLTPRVIRTEYARQAMELPEHERVRWLEARKTPLDRLVTDDETKALEDFAFCELVLAGMPRCADYTGDRVQTSRINMNVLPDNWLAILAKHHRIRAMLPLRYIQILQLFAQQMSDVDAPSDAEAAIMMRIDGADRRAAWALSIANIAKYMVDQTSRRMAS